MARDEHWVTVQEAARRLGVKDDAIRKRVQRGSLRSEKDLEDGRVYVYLETAQDEAYDTSYDATEDASRDGLVGELRDRVASLERMLDQEREARTEERRRHDTLMATLMQRIPELEAAAPEPPPEKASEGGNGGAPSEPENAAQHRSWWRRFFGF